MRRIYFMAGILFGILILTSCTKNYEQSDIKEYIDENLNLKSYRVSDTYEEIKGEDDYTDKRWTVTDGASGVEFHVLDNFYYGMEAVTNSLEDDYDASVFRELYKTFDVDDAITFHSETEEGMNQVYLEGHFTNRAELAACFAALTDYQEQVKDSGFAVDVYYSLLFDSAIRTIGDYEITSGDSHGYLSALDDEKYEDMLLHYYRCALSFRLEENLEEMSADDLNQVMNDGETHIICNTLEDGTVKTYENIIADSYYYGISFGSLYEILREEGFQVEGDAWHYTVALEDGSRYEFSYDFRENGYYYYKKDDAVVLMDYYFYNCLSCDKINEMFGLQLTESEKRFME